MLDFWNLHELVDAAYRSLPRNEWDFIMGGSETETTLRRNRDAIDSLAFRPRVMRNVTEVDRSTEFLGRTLKLPILIAPIGKQEFNGGPAAVAKAAQEFGCAFMLSSVNATSIEDVGQAAPNGLNILQLYVRGDDGWVREQVDRARAQNCAGLCVTVDTPVISRRERDFSNRYTSKNRRRFPGEAFQKSFDWACLERLRAYCPLPLIVKGISTAEDALMAVECGVDVIYVSNHGGRQLDHATGSIDDLREIADAVRGRAKLIVDGGIARGSDIVKATASGADLVGIGRLHCLALAAGGQEGVMRMFELLDDEVEITMSLLGASSFTDLDPSYLKRVPPIDISDPYAHSFPLLRLPVHEY